MDMFRKLYDFKGGRIRLEATDGEFEGVLKSLSTDIGRITLSHVLELPEKTPAHNNLHFFAHEIKSYSIVSTPEEEKKKKIRKKISPAELEMKLCSSQPHNIAAYLHQDEFDPVSEDESGENQETVDEIFNEGEYVLKLPDKLAHVLPLDHDIISYLDDSFYLAIKHIKTQKVVGVGFEGRNLGRYGELCWITVSTNCCTFLFDILALKENAFDEGLKDILESCNILKVIHDCRQPSDALYHLYKTELNNCFDTQVGDVFADMQNSKPGAVGKYVRPLRHCLMQFLYLKPSDLQFFKNTSVQGLTNEWHIRPLPNPLRDQAIKNVIYLRLLEETIKEKMLKSFYVAVDVYLNVVRGATGKELDLEPSVPHMLPEQLLSAGILTFHLSRFPKGATRTKKDLGFEEVPVDEDRVQAFLRDIENMEKKDELMNQKRREHPSSDEQNEDPNLVKDVSKTNLKHRRMDNRTNRMPINTPNGMNGKLPATSPPYVRGKSPATSPPCVPGKLPATSPAGMNDKAPSDSSSDNRGPQATVRCYNEDACNVSRIQLSKDSAPRRTENGEFIWPTVSECKPRCNLVQYAPAGVPLGCVKKSVH